MTIQSTATRCALTVLLLGSAVSAHAYIEQEQSTGVSNDAPSIAEAVGTLAPGGFLFISGARRYEAGVTDGGGGGSADFFRFEVSAAQLATLTIETPNASDKPVIGLFDSGLPNQLLASAFDDNSSASKFLSFSYQLAPGTYYAAVSGYRMGWNDFDGGGHSGWNYNLMIHSESMVTAVPEPESMAMLLAGLGVLGMVSRRRRSR
jgi:hypothetical protein